jgi:hypothetical protein
MTIAQQIEHEVMSWPGVSSAPHRYGGTEYRVAHHEIGHLHGSRLADLPFPRRVRDALLASGEAERHHILPETGWVSKPIRGVEDVPAVVALFRKNYERIVAATVRHVSAASEAM